MATGSLDTGRAYGRADDQRDYDRAPDAPGRDRRVVADWFTNLSMQAKNTVAVLVVLAIIVVQGIIAYRATNANAEAATWVAHTERVIAAVNAAEINAIDMQIGLRSFALTGRDESLVPYNNGRLALQINLRELKSLTADNPEQVRRWEDLEVRIAAWQRDVIDPGIALRREVNAGRASLSDVTSVVGDPKGDRQLDALRAVFDEGTAVENRLLQSRRADHDAATSRLRQAIAWGSIGVLAASIISGTITSRMQSRVSKHLARVATAIAAGQQDQRVTYRSRDELGQLADAFRAMIAYQGRMASAADAIARGELDSQVRPQSPADVLGNAFARMTNNLRGLVGELQGGTANLSSAGAEILAASAQQAAGATEQSAAIAETTATVDQVRSSAEQTVVMAQIVTETADQANRVAEEGVAAVREATAGMADIRERVQSIAENILVLSEQSQQIGEIIATVNDLADQSNLLALNAAIEASRAGEQGKGFTVVAQEIRTLAEGSKAATAQVRAILSDVQRATNAAVMATEQGTKGVDVGIRTIDRAGRTIDGLADAIHQASGSAAQISASVRQHAVGMEQIAVAMASINDATAQNLAAVMNTQEAAENLADLAGRLNGLIGQYRM